MKVYTRLLNNNFWDWFEDSKGVFDVKEPQVFYHKSRSIEPFEEFKHEGVIKNDYNDCHGFYFVAEANQPNIDYMGNGLGYYVYLRMNNPFYIYADINGGITDSNGNTHKSLDISGEFCFNLHSQGYDSIIVSNPFSFNEYIVFNPNQIKSITNNGDYSKTNNNIYK